MPIGQKPASASRGAYTALQSGSEVRLNPLQKFLRFMGFSRIRVLYDTSPKLPARTNDLWTGSGKDLLDRDVATVEPARNARFDSAKPKLAFHDTEPSSVWSNIHRQYLGFKANTKNINRLYHDILESKVACRDDESDEQYRNRVALIFIACDLADSHNGELRERHSLNRPLSKKQLLKLKASLHRLFHEVVREVNQGHSKAKRLLDREIDRHPRLLMEVCTHTPIETKQDLLFVDRHCQRYLTTGEGRQVLKECGFPEAVNKQMENILPTLPADDIDDQVIGQAVHFQEACKRTDATNNAGKTINDIFYVPGKSEQAFQPDSPGHRCLVMIQSMAMGWQAYCDGRASAVNQIDVSGGVVADQIKNDDAEALGMKLLKTKQTLNDVWLAISHNIMLGTNDLSTNFDRKNYQQVVLRSDDDKTVYWNSDNVQPRGGWFDSRRFDPVTLPK